MLRQSALAIAGLAMVVGLASAQDWSGTAAAPQGMLVCDSASGACGWRAGAAQDPADASPGVYAGTGQDPTTITAPETPVRWLFGWAPSPPSPLILRKAPAPQCAVSVDEAMGRVQTGLATGDLNLMFSGYDWAGHSTESAQLLTDRLALLTPGEWQARVVEGRMGGPAETGKLKQPPERVRLLNASGAIQAEFSAVERMRCWFLRLEPISPRDPVSDASSAPAAGGNVIEILSPGDSSTPVIDEDVPPSQ